MHTTGVCRKPRSRNVNAILRSNESPLAENAGFENVLMIKIAAKAKVAMDIS